MSENKECLFYIDHNPPEYSGTWGGAIHKGACKLNSTDCKDTDGCFIKNLYNKLKIKEQECEELNSDNRYFVDKIISLESLTDKYELALKEIEKIIDNGTADTQTNNAKWLQQYYLTRFWEISNIINEVMGEE